MRRTESVILSCPATSRLVSAMTQAPGARDLQETISQRHMSLRAAQRRSNLNSMGGRLLRFARNDMPQCRFEIVEHLFFMLLAQSVKCRGWGQRPQETRKQAKTG